MMKTMKLLAIAMVVIFGLTSCGVVVSLIVGEDVGVSGVTSTQSDILFYASNFGWSEDDVEYEVYFSTNQFATISVEDSLVYADSIDLEWTAYDLITVRAAEWQDFAQTFGDDPPFGNYYIKVWIDPNYELNDSDLSDNIAVSALSYDL